MTARNPDTGCKRCSAIAPPHRLGLCNTCYQRDRNRVGYRSTYVDAGPVREHIEHLIRARVRVSAIAKASGVSHSSIDYILRGRVDRYQAPARQVSRKTAKAILGVRLEHLRVLEAARR